MTLEERLQLLEDKVKRDADIIAHKEKLKKDLIDNYMKEISSLSDRIDAILKVANKCVELGIELPPTDETIKKEFRFKGDAIIDNVGLIRAKNNKYYDYVGYYSHSPIGYWNFYVNSKMCILVKCDNNTKTKTPDYIDIENPVSKYLIKFVNDFKIFEINFYKWIDAFALEN